MRAKKKAKTNQSEKQNESEKKVRSNQSEKENESEEKSLDQSA
jgi:hypothetical protein